MLPKLMSQAEPILRSVWSRRFITYQQMSWPPMPCAPMTVRQSAPYRVEKLSLAGVKMRTERPAMSRARPKKMNGERSWTLLDV